MQRLNGCIMIFHCILWHVRIFSTCDMRLVGSLALIVSIYSGVSLVLKRLEGDRNKFKASN